MRLSTSHLWKGAIRWLEPLDLEVAADEGENLLAAVLVRIFEAIDRSSLTASKACRDAMDRLDELANDIGIAWDGNLRDRAASLDPDSYSQETLRTQQARLSTNRRLRFALEALLKNNCYGFCKEALFVLPIDDFYLKPQASLELLRLLRMVSVPRLFLLIMGDIKTVEALFFEKALADWTAVAGPQVFATLRERTNQDVLPRAREMRARYLRKLIPTGQRAVVGWTDWDYALRFRPPVTTDSDSALQLRHLLCNVSIRWPDGPDRHGHNLLNYLISPAVTMGDRCKATECSSSGPDPKEGKGSKVKKFREAYSGLQILDATPREILDLWLHLRRQAEACQDTAKSSEAREDEEDDKYLRSLLEYAIPAMEEQDFLTEEDQEVLRFVFPGSDRDDLLLGTDRLHVSQKLSPWQNGPEKRVLVRGHLDWKVGILDYECQKCKCQSRQEDKGDLPDKKVSVHRHFDWKLCVLDCESRSCRGQNRSKGKRFLPPRQAAWLILLHDLAWNWRRNSVLENLVQRLLMGIEDLSNQIRSTNLDKTHPGWAWYREREDGEKEDAAEEDAGGVEKKDAESEDRWVHFPLPEFDTFRQLDRFLAIWSYKPGTRRREPPEDPMAAVQKWAIAAWIVERSEECYEEYVKLFDDSRKKDDSPEWYEECALLLDKSGDADGSTEGEKFADFRKRLFAGHEVLLGWGDGGGKLT